MKHPYLTAGLVLGGVFLAYNAWGRTPGDKAKVGDTVQVPFKDLQLTPALAPFFPEGLPAGSTVWILIAGIDGDVVTGRLLSVGTTVNIVDFKTPQVLVKTTRKAIMGPSAPTGKLLPVTTI